MDETIEDRLAAVERALTDGDHDCSALAEGAASAERIVDLESDVEELADRVAELEAATQALRGYVGNVRSINNEVEQRADAALAKAETAHRVATATETPGNGGNRDGPTGGCEHCDRPVGGESRERSSHSGSGPERSRLGELRDGTGPKRRRGGATDGTVGAETDGGQPQSTREPGSPDQGLIARIRDLV